MIFRIIIIFILTNCIVYSVNIKEKNMKQNWERLFKHWSNQKIDFWNNGKLEKFTDKTTCRGATSKDIDKIKNYYSNIPDDLLESLTICNEGNRWFGFNGWGLLYGTNEILETSISFEKSTKNSLGIYKVVEQGIVNPTTLFPKEWIPIFDWNGVYIIAIDMLSKNKGQIIIISIEDSTIRKWTNSYSEWFTLVVTEVLTNGELKTETIESILKF